ncbi:MAG: ATP-binding cassette domain-containing protein, partial [Clostridiales bacterium]|nr:ATP-binding cassette domain-containing protein [Clostridiales bacterium]
MDVLVEIKNVTKLFPVHTGIFSSEKGRKFAAVEDVSFSIEKGRTLGLVGESGSGKTTIANLLLKLICPDKGRIFFNGEDITHLHKYKQ